MEKVQDNLRVFVVPVQILEDENTTPHEKLVYMVLRSFVNPHTNMAFPSQKTIMRLSGLSKSTVIRVLQSLTEKGYIKKEIRFDYNRDTKKARQTSNLYTLTLPDNHTDTGGVSHRHGGGVTQTRGGCHTDTGGGVTQTHHDHNHLDHNQLMIDNDRIDNEILKIGRIVFEKYKDKITEEEYNEIIDRVIKAKPKNIMKYIQTAFDRHLQSKASPEPKRYTRKSGKPKIEMVQATTTDPDATKLTDEEMIELQKIVEELDKDK